MTDPKWIHEMARKIDTISIISVREQIQEDIITYASALDDGSDGGCLTDEMVSQLCDIVVSNFNKIGRAHV